MQRVTMEDVAREAGVSRALVSIAYRGVTGVSDATRDRILEVGTALGYVPNNIAARLAGKGGDTVGVYLQDLHNEIFADIFDGIRNGVEDAGLQFVLSVGAIDGSLDTSSLETLIASRVDVLIAAGLLAADGEIQRASHRVPIVSVARAVPGVDSVFSNNLAGSRIATTHLIELGHLRIAFLANPQTDGYLDRQSGYEATMRDHGLRPIVVPTTYSRQRASADAGALLDSANRPTAIFAHNDRTALGVLDALQERGLIPGTDVSVVGYDNTSASRAPGSALTTVDIHSVQLGEQATRLAMRRLEAPAVKFEHVMLEPTLVVRESTGPVQP